MSLGFIILLGSIQGDITIPGGAIGIVRGINKNSVNVFFKSYQLSVDLPFRAVHFIGTSQSNIN